MARRIEAPPSNVTGALGHWLRRVQTHLEAQPNVSLLSFAPTDTPNSRATGVAGDLVVNLGSGTTDNRLWILGGTPASVYTDQGWVPVLGGGVGGGLPAHATRHDTGGVDALSAVSAAIVKPTLLGAPTVNNLQLLADHIGSAGFYTGGTVSASTLTGKVDVAAGAGLIRASAVSTDPLLPFEWSATTALSTTTNATNFIWADYNSGSPTLSVGVDEFVEAPNKVLVGMAVNEGGVIYQKVNAGVRLQEGIGQAGRYIRRVFGLVRDLHKGGIMLGQTGTRNISLTAGTLWWGRTEYAISAIDTSGSGTFDTYYYDGAAWQRTTGVTQWPNTQYNDITSGLVTMTAAKWANLWFYVLVDGSLAMVYGRAQYTTQADAQLGSTPSTLPPRLQQLAVLAGRLTFQKSASTGTVSSAFVTQFQNTGVTDHGDLTGLADDDHTQYVLRSLLTTQGDLPYAGVAAAWSRLAIGTTNYVLTSSGTVPQWSAGLSITTLATSGLISANAGLTVASGQTLTVTGATITGLTAASVGAGTFPSGAFVFQGAVSGVTTFTANGDISTTNGTIASDLDVATVAPQVYATNGGAAWPASVLGGGASVAPAIGALGSGASARFLAVAVGASVVPGFYGFAARNTVASMQAVQSSDSLISLRGWGYNGSGFGATSGAGTIAVLATETHSPTAAGTQIVFSTTANTTTTLAAALTLGQDKSATFAGAVSGITTLSMSGALTYGGVTLSAAVTGTGNMVLSASPTFTGTAAFAAVTTTGNLVVNSAITLASTGAVSGVTTLSLSGVLTSTSSGGANFGSGLTTEDASTEIALQCGTNAGSNNKNADIQFKRSSTLLWMTGLIDSLGADGAYRIYDAVNTVTAFKIAPGAAPAVTFAGAVSGITTLGCGAITTTGALTVQMSSAQLDLAAASNTWAVIRFHNVLNTVKWTVGRGVSAGSNNDFVVWDNGSGQAAIAITAGAAPAVAFAGPLSGITTLGLSGAITGATATNTINGVIINSGAVSGVTTLAGTGAVSGFTTAAFSGSVSTTVTGVTAASFASSGATTDPRYLSLANTGGTTRLYIESSVAGTSWTNSTAYASILGSATDTSLEFGTSTVVRAGIVGAAGTPANSSVGNIYIYNGTAPTGNPTGMYYLWAESGAFKGRGTSGTVTTIGTAEPHCPVCGSDFGLEWHNDQYGGTLQVCVKCLVADVAADKPYIRHIH